jgi:putative ABC transport system substrate-binding protein
MDRRTAVALAGAALAAPRALLAQPAKRVFRVAILDDAEEGTRAEHRKVFRDRLRELDAIEGRTTVYEARYAGGSPERLPALASELISLQPDILVTFGTPAAIAAKKATSSIPIVFTAAGDPVGTGLVATLARPGGNATGTSSLTTNFISKLLELLQELSPGAKRIAYLTDISNPGAQLAIQGVKEHARSRKLSLQVLDGRERSELERSLEATKRDAAQGLIVGVTPVILKHRDRLLQFVTREKIPAVYGRREYVDAGGLLSYAADQRFVFERSADYVHRILKGASPADLPVEQSTRQLLVLNLKSARELGIKVPDSIRLRADEIIE